MRATSVVSALLHSAEPSIRWKTRVHVLGEERGSRAIRALQEEIRRSPRVRALLSRRDQLGRPGTARRVYYKWQGVHWVLASLADLGYPSGDKTLHAIRDRVLDFWLGPRYFHEFEARTEAAAYRQRGVPLMRGRYRRWCVPARERAVLPREPRDRRRPSGFPGRTTAPLAMAGRRVELRQGPGGGYLFLHGDDAAHARTRSARGTGQIRNRRESGRECRRGLPSPEALSASLGWSDHSPDFVTLHYPLYWHYDFLGGLRAMTQIGRIMDPRCADALDLLEKSAFPMEDGPRSGAITRSAPRPSRPTRTMWTGEGRTRSA